MSSKAQAPASTLANVLLGAGAIYFDYGEVTEACIGATQGGSTFTVERAMKDIEQDGAYGPIKDRKYKTRVVPMLKVKALELSITTMPKYFGGLSVDSSGVNYDVVTENIDLASGDYLTNIAFVGENAAGEDIVIIVKNALGDGNIELAIEDKKEVVPETQFTGHYASDALTTVPYEMRFPKTSTDTNAPTVTVVPADTATNFVVTSNIVWTFNEAIAHDTINAANFFVMKSDGTAVAGALSHNAAQTVITFDPTSSLSAGTDYIAIATTGVTDLNGNALAANSVSNFQTAS
jgi:hypothetical protein